MKALLVYPEFPVTYWGFQHSLPFINRRATLPPLGLITLAAQLPRDWELRLVDLNVQPLDSADFAWADVVLTGGMGVQTPSTKRVLRLARALGRPSAVGGPAASATPERFPEADVVFVGEAEGRVGELVGALIHGEPRVVQPRGERPRLTESPVPRFDLLDANAYCSMSIQASRGCPFQCEFCDVVEQFGRVPRVKPARQVLAELDALFALGHRGSVFVVDDNFIGNRRAAGDLLPALASWQRDHRRPFELYTEASVNLARDPALMAQMVRAGFTSVFVGVETPSAEALRHTRKYQNAAVELSDAIAAITRAGLQVMGGFIVGFDTDGPEIFDAQRAFLREAPIPLAMLGLLVALPKTELWRRMEREGRLRGEPAGDVFGRPNFTPAMGEETLMRGWGSLLEELYSPAGYYRRVRAFLDLVGPTPSAGLPSRDDLAATLRALWRLGVRGSYRRAFWETLSHAVRRRPSTLRHAVQLAIQGEHLIRYTRDEVLPGIGRACAELSAGTRAVRARAEAGASSAPAFIDRAAARA